MIRSLALLLAGAAIGILGSVLVGQFGFSWPLVSLLLVVFVGLVVFGTGTDLAIVHRYHLWARRKRPKIGILNDIEWNPDILKVSTSTDISPSEWQREIEKQARDKGMKLRVELMRTRSNFDSYAVVVNPYGGTYPEHDLVSLHTLNKIFQYVQERGLFVNVADIPGYWAYHPALRKRTETAPPVWVEVQGTLRAVRPFPVVPWMQKLGLSVSNVEAEFREPVNLVFEAGFQSVTGSKIPGVRLHRAAIVEENMEAVDEVSTPDSAGQHTERASIFWVRYYDGSFLISLVSLSGQSETAKEGLRKVLASLILSRLM